MVGTCLGARMAGPRQRTTRLAKALTTAYVVVGVVITVPITTHAVKLDMSLTSASSKIDLVRPLVLLFGFPLLIVVIALIMTRAFATICARVDRAA